MPLDSSTSISITLTGIVGGIVTTQTFQVWDEGTGSVFARDGMESSAWRQIVIAWTDYPQFVNLIRGGGYYVSGSYAYYSSLVYPTAPTLLCFERIQTDGIPIDGLSNDANSLVAYKYGRARIIYKPVRYPQGANAATMRVNYGVQIVTIPNTSGNPLYQFSDGTKALLPITQRLGTAEIELTLYNCSQIPSATFQPLIGDINNGPFTIYAVNSGVTPYGGSFVGDTGTLLFNGPQTVQEVLTTGGTNFTCVYSWSWRSIRWDFEMVSVGSNAGQFLKCTRISDGASLYTLADMTPLLSAS